MALIEQPRENRVIDRVPEATQPILQPAQEMPETLPPPTYHEIPRRRRSFSLQYRFIRTLSWAFWLMIRLLFWYYVVDHLLSRHEYVQCTNTQRWQGYAREFRSFAVSMGGVMIKLGQFISTRFDVLPPEILEELAGLQDSVPSIPFPKIRAVIEDELGPIDARYQQISEVPVAAASLGQVHRARLLNGEKVVVKVQRPGIDQICYTDLAALRIVGRVAMLFRFVRRRADTGALVEEFGRVLLEELSYRQEAINAVRFAKMFKNDLGVYVPHVYTDHCTDHVLTLEDVTSIKITDYEAIEAAGISRKVVAKRLMHTYLKQIFEDRFFHADPHPGNLFVYPLPVEDEQADFGEEGRPFYLIFIDFGMTGSLTEKITAGLINTLGAVFTRNPQKMVQSYVDLGFLLPGADIQRIEEATVMAFNQVWGLSMAELRDIDFDEIATLGKEFNDLLYDMPFYVPQDFIYLGRAISILSGMCTTLDSSFNPWKDLQEHAQYLFRDTLASTGASTGIAPLDSLLNGNAPQALLEIGQTLIKRAIDPNAGQNAIIQRLESGDVKFHVEAGYKLQRQLGRVEHQERITTRAVIFGSLLISSTLLYVNGDIAIAVVGYVFSGITFLTLIFNSSEGT